MMEYYKMGKGPYYLFYRPYHLCHVEAIASVVEPIIDGRPLMQPEKGFQTDVYAYAKRDLKADEMLDGLGGYNCYGMIENCKSLNGRNRLPILLAENVKLKRDIRKDEMINFEDVVYDRKDYAFDLFFKTIEVSDALKQRNLRSRTTLKEIV
jgi:predicted homoserine dehydrogenase-like protein